MLIAQGPHGCVLVLGPRGCVLVFNINTKTHPRWPCAINRSVLAKTSLSGAINHYFSPPWLLWGVYMVSRYLNYSKTTT